MIAAAAGVICPRRADTAPRAEQSLLQFCMPVLQILAHKEKHNEKNTSDDSMRTIRG